MEKILKKRAHDNIIMAIVLVIVAPLIGILAFIIRTGHVSSLLEIVNPSVYSIEIGTDLSQYKDKRVTCSVRNVVYHVVGIYDRDDPAQVVFTESYLVTDDNYEHPTLIFFPVSKAERLNTMRDKTWNEMNGEPETIIPLQLEGYVRKLGDHYLHYYDEAMSDLYDKDTTAHAVDVYFIDDEGVLLGDTKKDDLFVIAIVIGLLELIMISILIMTIVQSKKYLQVIEAFMLNNRVNRLDLDRMFYDTLEIEKNYWISPELTVSFDGMHFIILSNANISRIKINRISGRSVVYRIKFFSRDLEKCGKLWVNNSGKIVEYYKQNCPHIEIDN